MQRASLDAVAELFHQYKITQTYTTLLYVLLTTLVTYAGILSALQCTSLEALCELLGPDGSQALTDLQALWKLAEGYGYADWLVFDASVVRGLAYYTGEGRGTAEWFHFVSFQGASAGRKPQATYHKRVLMWGVGLI